MPTAKYNLTVIGPAYNESRNIIELAERLQSVFSKKNINGQILLVDDYSTDDTGKIMDELAAVHSNVKIIHNQSNQGIAKSWSIGLAQAEGQYVCLMDTDLQNLPEDVWRLYQEIIFTNIDLLQGWRNHIGRQKRDIQYYLSQGLNFLLNKLFRMNLRDNKSGFIICRREVLEDILKHKKNYYHFQTFITVAARAKNYSIREIETLFEDRKFGKSYLSGQMMKVSLQTFLDILRGLFEFRVFDWYDTSLRDFLAQHQPQHLNKELTGWRKWWFKIFVLFFPLHHWMISYNAAKYYHDLKRSQWLKPEEIRNYQEKKLCQLITYAYYHVPFYRDAFNRLGLQPEDVRTIKDLQKLPVIDKQTVRENMLLGMLSNSYDKNKMLKVTTSGSTGEPLICYSGKKALEIRWASHLRSSEWTGYRFGDKQVRLWHKYIGLSKMQIFKEIIDAFLSRRRFIPAYEISDENLGNYVKKIMKYKPVVLDGYAESFNLIAWYLKNNIYQGHKPKGIMSSAQTLPDSSRKIIEEGFGCKVFDKYGSREFTGGIAYQCEKGNGYHVAAECNIIEILKHDGSQAKPGEVGMAIITDLNNYAMPLIRYKIGDLIVQRDPDERCSCGRGLPLIGAIEGRPQATIIGANKQYLPGSFFARLFGDYEGIIKQFQVVQEKYGEIILRLIKGNLYTEKHLEEIKRVIRKHLGEEIKINIEFLKEIPLGKNAKRIHSISYIDVAEISKNF